MKRATWIMAALAIASAAAATARADGVRVLDELEGARTDLGGGIGEFLARWRGRHLAFVVSDLFQERPLTAVLDELLWRGVEPHLVQVVDDAELAPLLRGRCAVEDVEGGGALRLYLGPGALRRL